MLVPTELIDLNYVAPGYLQPTATFLFDVTLLGIGLGGVLFVMLLRARELKAAQRSQRVALQERSARALSRGPHRVVKGRVECDAPNGVAVEIRLVQELVEHSSKNRRWYEWRELSRSVHSSPFYLVPENGPAVFVEPGDNVVVIDSLETELANGERRTRRRLSKITHGETVFAYGDLHEGAHPRATSGYRDGGVGWILRAPQRSRMLFATGALTTRHQGRIGFLNRWAPLFATVWALFHLFVTLPFAALALAGHQTEAMVFDQTASRMTSGKNRSWHYKVIAQAADGISCSDEVAFETYSAIQEYRSVDTNSHPTIPILHVGNLFCRLGTQPTAPSAPIAIGLLVAIGAIYVARKRYQRTFEWYDQKKVIEYGGEGVWNPKAP